MVEFKKFADMRKNHFGFVDGQRKYIIDTDSICEAVAACDDFNDMQGGYSAKLLSNLISGKINSALALHPYAWDLGGFEFVSGSGRKYFADFECDKTCVYSAKTGKQIYKYIRVRGLRLASFAPRACYRDSADFSRVFGRWSLGSGSCCDVEI